MKPPLFDYVLAENVEAALDALVTAGGDAKILAGGQSLLPMLNFRLLRPSVLVDINRIAQLSFIEEDATCVRVGATTRHYHLETSPIIARCLPVIPCAMAHVAHLAIRNRGTLGGSLSHADPAAELPLLAVLLDANLVVESPAGRRECAASGFFHGALTVALRSDELLVEIVWPKMPPSTGWAFEEVARRHGDFALAAVAVTLSVVDGVVASARIAATGVGPTPIRFREVEGFLEGQALDRLLTVRATEGVRAAIAPETDLHASADYRRHLAGVLTGRALTAAWSRANGTAV